MKANINICIENGYKNVPDKVGIIFEDQRYTYADIYDTVNRLTNALLQLGVVKGSRIGYLAKNRPESVFIYYAASRIGAVFTAFDYGVSSENLQNMIKTIGPEILFVDADCLNKCIKIHRQLDSVRFFVSISKRHASYLYYPDLISHASQDYYIGDVDGEDPTAILFTSGTTGNRKAVAFSHNDFINHVFNTNSISFIENRGVSIVTVPIWHIIGFQAFTTVFYFCRTLVMMADFSASLWLRLVKENRVNFGTISPTMLSSIIYDPMFDISYVESVKDIQIGGDSASPSLVRDALSKFPKYTMFRNVYGLTETTFDIAALRNEDYVIDCDDPDERVRRLVRLSSIGTPMEQVQIIIADEKENELERGSIGEVLIHSARAMIGYVSDDSHEITPQYDYWFHSNDMGYMDKDGYIFLLGQKIDSPDGRNQTGENFYAPNFIVYPFEETEVKFNEMYMEDLLLSGSARDRSICYRLDVFFKGLYSTRSIHELITFYQENIVEFIPASAFGIHLMPYDLGTEEENSDVLVKWDMPLFESVPLDTFDVNISSDDEVNDIARHMLEKCTSLAEYIETIKPEHLVCTPLFSSKRTLMGILSFSRVDANWPFSPIEQRIIRIIASNTCIAVSNVLEYDSLKQKNNILESMVKVTGLPVIATDRQGQILYINQHANVLIGGENAASDLKKISECIAKNTDLMNDSQKNTRHGESFAEIEKGRFCLQTTLADFSPRVYITVMKAENRATDFSYLGDILSNREIEIVTLVARGYDNVSIANEIHVSVNTVKYHLKNIFQKMDVSSRSQLLTKAYTFEYRLSKN